MMDLEVEVGGDVDFGFGGGGGRRTIRMVGGEWKTAWKMMSKSSRGRRWRWVWRVVVVLGLVMVPFFFSFLLLMLGAWGGGSSCFFTCFFTIESSSTEIRKSWRCGGGSWLVYVSSL